MSSHGRKKREAGKGWLSNGYGQLIRHNMDNLNRFLKVLLPGFLSVYRTSGIVNTHRTASNPFDGYRLGCYSSARYARVHNRSLSMD